MNEKSDGLAFEKDVAELLALMGYKVEANRWKAGRQTDLIVSRQVFPSHLEFLVECKDWKRDVPMEVIRDMHARLDAVRRTGSPEVRGWIISSHGFALNAKEHAISLGIYCTSYAELLDQLIDFRPYLNLFVDDYENLNARYFDKDGLPKGQPLVDLMLRCDLYRLFVPLDLFIKKEVPTKENEKHKIVTERKDAIEYLSEWLEDPTSNHLTMLGDFGSGKSSLVLKLTYTLAKRYIQYHQGGGARCRIPLLVPLRDYYRRLDLESLVTNLALNHYGLSGSSWPMLKKFMESGRLLLILDGFDEMVTRSSPHETIENLREICKLALPNTKTILTCRTHYFRDQREVDKAFGDPTDNPLMRQIRSYPHFRVVDLAPLSDRQIKIMLSLRLGAEQAANVLQEIHRTYNLWDLSQRPVLCDMITKTLPSLVRKGTVINAAQLYDAYTAQWIETDDWRSIMTSLGKRGLMEELSCQMFFSEAGAERHAIHYSELPKPEPGFFKEMMRHDPKAFDLYDHDTRTCSFLNRDSDGNYKFIHKSFMEFFLACRLQRHIKDGNISLLSQFNGNKEVMFFLRGLEFNFATLKEFLGKTLVQLNSGEEIAFQVILPRMLEDLTPRGHAAWACFCYRAARAHGKSAKAPQIVVGKSVAVVEAWIESDVEDVSTLVEAVTESLRERDEAAYLIASCARRAVAALYPGEATGELAVRAVREVASPLESEAKSSFWEHALITLEALRLRCCEYESGPGSPIPLLWKAEGNV